MKALYSKNIVTLEGVIEGYILLENKKIKDIVDEYSGEYDDYSNDIILPGFIDQHIHGWGRGSMLYENNEKALKMMIEDQAKEGVTGFLATTFTDDLENIYKSIEVVNKFMDKQNLGSKLLGMHLEGPFINPEQAGAQKSEYCINPSVEIFSTFEKKCEYDNQIKLVTIAPELEGAQSLIEHCRDNKIQVSAGHTKATFKQIIESKSWGVGGVTHMYGAMTPMHHRELGTVGAALYDKDLYCEFAKQTGITVHHEAFDIAFRIKTADRIIHSTDCLGNGMQSEPYYHAKRDVWFIPEGNYLIERKADGSSEKKYDLSEYDSLREIEMSYIDSVKNLLKHTPMSWVDVSKITSKNPADYINLEDRGEIRKGMFADFTIITPQVELVSTIVEGELVYGK